MECCCFIFCHLQIVYICQASMYKAWEPSETSKACVKDHLKILFKNAVIASQNDYKSG